MRAISSGRRQRRKTAGPAAGPAAGRTQLTIRFGEQLDGVTDANVDDAEEALVLLLELALVKDLDGEYAVLVDTAGEMSQQGRERSNGPRRVWNAKRGGPGGAYKSKLSFQYGFRVRFETEVVFVCSLLMVATAKGSGKPAVGRRVSNQMSTTATQRCDDRGARGVTYERRRACTGHRQQ